MALTRGRNQHSQQTVALSIVGSAALAKTDEILTSVDSHLNAPLRVFATQPVADAILNIGPSSITTGDGATKSLPPIDDTIQDHAGATINAQTGATTGGTLQTDGAAFALPTATGAGKFFRMAIVYDATNNALNTTFSDEAASEGALPDPGLVFTTLDGVGVAYVDLESTSTTEFKTAASSTAIVENAKIYRFGSAGAGGGGGSTDFKLQSIAGTTATLKKGFYRVAGERTLVSGAGTDSGTTNVDIAVDLDTILGTAPVDATTYYLYIDMDKLGNPINLTDTGEEVTNVSTESEFAMLTSPPSGTNSDRYVFVGRLRSADTGNAWTGTGSSFRTRSNKVAPGLSHVFNNQAKKTYQLTSAVASDVTAHGLSGKPTSVTLTYFDGAKELGLDLSSHLLDLGLVNIEISTLGLTFGGGEYVQVQAIYNSDDADEIAFAGAQFASAWYQDTATTTVPHGLSDMEDIRGYVVQEWDVTGVKRRNLDAASGLVVNFDDTNIYLDWAGLTPTSTLQYRVVAGGRALPIAVPLGIGGYTKFVGFGPGSYLTLTAALSAAAPGDSILVNRSYSIAVEETISVSDISITFQAGTVITTTAGSVSIRVTGNRVDIMGLNLEGDFAGTITDALRIEGNDCNVGRTRIRSNNAGLTITNAILVDAGASRNDVNAAVNAVLGTITNTVIDNGTDTGLGVRG
jgi:hypothetical protein